MVAVQRYGESVETTKVREVGARARRDTPTHAISGAFGDLCASDSHSLTGTQAFYQCSLKGW